MRINNVQYADAYELRQTLTLPIKLSQMLSFEQEIIKQKLTPKKREFLSPCPCGKSKSKKKFLLSEQFIETYKSMNQKQQISLYSNTVNYLNSIAQGKVELDVAIEQTEFQNIKIKSGFRWVEHSIRLDLNQGIMFIFGPKSQILNLSQYLIRTSTNTNINCFVLSSTKSNFTKVIRFSIECRINFESCYEAVHNLIQKLLFVKLKNDYDESNKQLYSSLLLKESKLNRYASHDKLLPTKQTPKQLFNCTSEKIVNISYPVLTVQNFRKDYQFHDIYFDVNEFLPKGYDYNKLTKPQNYVSYSDEISFIKQLTEDDETFRLEKIFNIPFGKVLELLSNVSDFKKWNSCVTSSKIEFVFSGKNSIIISQTRQPASKQKQFRKFTYIRSLFSKNNKIYIVDRSINKINGNSKERGNNKNGSIVLSFWKIVPMKNYTLVEGLIKFNHNYTNKKAEIEMTKQYIEEYLNFDNYQKTESSRIQCKQLFNIEFEHTSHVQFISQLFNPSNYNSSSKHKQNIPESDKPRKQHIDDESFYTAQGASDWNSKILNYNKIRGFGSLSSIKSIKKIPTKQFIMQPIQQQTSIIKDTSSFLGSAKDVLKKNEIEQKELQKHRSMEKAKIKEPAKKSSINSTSSDPYKKHICKTQQITLDKKGMAIIPLDYISQYSPTIPKANYPYEKMKGENWNHYLCKDDWVILDNGQLKFKNQEKLKFQNGVLTKVLKKVATNLISGKGFNVSLPVEVFSQLSIFQLTARGMCFAPLSLQKAVLTTNRLQRMKHFISFSLGFSLSYLQMAKPFNPILGETYQGWINGCPFYCEQTSHHPPITSYLLIGRGYKVYGNITPQMNLSMNSGVGYNSGECVVVFDDDPTYKIFARSPGGQIQGLTYGDRKFNLSGKGFYYDNEGLYSQITFNCFKKSLFSFSKQTEPVDSLEGRIYQINPQEITKFRKKFDRDGINKKELKEQVCSISGKYTQQLLFDNKVYFDAKNDEPCMLQQEKYPLASNCNYRQDIIYKRRNDNQRAQVEKQRLENIQRNDKKLRGGH